MNYLFLTIAAVLMTFGCLLSSSETYSGNSGMLLIFGIIAGMIGAVLHMRKRRNEQLDAMRGKIEK